MRPLRQVLGIAVLASFATAAAGDEAASSSASDEFLEYLGSWDGDDADWPLVSRIEPAAASRVQPSAGVPGEGAEGAGHPPDEAKAEIAQE